MQKIFQEYGGVITTAMAIVALIGLLGLLFTPGGTGWMDGAFKNVIRDFADKVDGAEPGQERLSCGIEGHSAGDGRIHGVAVTDCDSGHTYTCECAGWVVPEGGTYYVGVTSYDIGDYTGATATYTAGQELPCGYVTQDKDTYVFGDYEYRYNYCYHAGVPSSRWTTSKSALGTTQNAWGARVLDSTQTTYGEILDTINGSKVLMHSTFLECTSIATTPPILGNIELLSSTFRECLSITSVGPVGSGADVEIPNNITALDHTFYLCSNLSNVIIPNGVTTIGDSSFRNCSNITQITFEEGSRLTTIGSSAFNHCTSVTTFTIPQGVTTLGDRAFIYCESLTGITVPDSVTSIGLNCFYRCYDLTDIVFEGTVEQWNAITFGENWNYQTSATEVVCTGDENGNGAGTVSLS